MFSRLLSQRLCHALTQVRALCYSAFGSPNLGITWALVTLVSGLIYLAYKERKRRNFTQERARDKGKLDNSYQAAARLH